MPEYELFSSEWVKQIIYDFIKEEGVGDMVFYTDEELIDAIDEFVEDLNISLNIIRYV